MRTVLELAWAAGIYEGEGSCRPGLGGRAGIGASVSQKDPWLPERPQQLFGGSIGVMWSELNGAKCLSHVWHIHGARARGFLLTIYPLLSAWRQRQAQIALLRTARTAPRSLRADYCIHGHELTTENIYVDPRGWRSCRACGRLRGRRGYRPSFPRLSTAVHLLALPYPTGSRLLRFGPGNPSPVTPVEIAWAAGIYEGEGSCQPNATGKSYRIGASVTQKDRWILERLRAIFGGGIGVKRSRLHGKTYMTPVWFISGPRARGFLMTIYPFLSPRRSEGIRVALARTSAAVATAEFCRRGHSVKESAAYQRSGRYCRRCKNEKARQRYANDVAYREHFLRRLREGRIARFANGPQPNLANPKRPSERCRKGHLFTPENTIANPYRGRQCRTCWNAWHREWERRRRSVARTGP